MSAQVASAAMSHPYVEHRPAVHGGRAVIRGSRFPVSSIVQNHRRGLSVDEILHEFPHLQPAEVYDALSYYYDHRDEIDAEIGELTDLKTIAQHSPPSVQPPSDGGAQDLS